MLIARFEFDGEHKLLEKRQRNKNRQFVMLDKELKSIYDFEIITSFSFLLNINTSNTNLSLSHFILYDSYSNLKGSEYVQ